MVDAYAASVDLAETFGVQVAPATIRSWASRGHVTRMARDGRRRLYDLDELRQRVESGLLAS
jgi:DNA-binding transcriptional MerR regulator